MPPKWVSTMSQVQKYQGVNGPSYDTVSEAFRWFSLLLALGMIVTALLGLVMAFQKKIGDGRRSSPRYWGCCCPSAFSGSPAIDAP